MKKFALILLSLILLFSGCQNSISVNKLNNEPETTVESTATVLSDESETPTIQPEATATPQPSPTATPEAPQKPKYIFIVIGDGMGQGAASLGEIYARIEAEDMQQGAIWESFEQQHIVGAMLDSSSGGTALSCGVKSKQGYIALNLDEQPMYTIMDRAKEAGFGTGVVTNSSLADATAAVFTSHTLSRYDYGDLVSQIGDSNVDYLAGGGLRFFASYEQTADMPLEDCYGISTYYAGAPTLQAELEEMGYNMHYGKQGAEDMLGYLESKDCTEEKAIYPLSLVYMPWEIDKYKASNVEKFEAVPSLCDMTRMGIETLSQNPNGFVMMVEEAFIDKAAHLEDTVREIHQINLLNDTLEIIMEFYDEHPDETLVVLTADHETGNYLYNEDLMKEFKQLPNFVWTDDGDELSEFLTSQWGLAGFESYYHQQITNSKSDVWQSEEEARAQAIAAITEVVGKRYGSIITTPYHSRQDVPLYATGNGSERFADCQHIAEVPIFICEIMGWRAMPEALPEE